MSELWQTALFLVIGLIALPMSLFTQKALNPFRQFGDPFIISRADAPKRYWASIAVTAIAIAIFCWVIWGELQTELLPLRARP
jgi:hypothetical protein